jgi:hypothetical protein
VSVDNVRTLACTHRWSHGCVGCANHSAAPRTCCSQGEAKNKAQRHADAVEMVIPDTGDVCCPAVCPSTPVYMELEILIIPCAHKVCFGALWGALGKRPRDGRRVQRCRRSHGGRCVSCVHSVGLPFACADTPTTTRSSYTDSSNFGLPSREMRCFLLACLPTRAHTVLQH